MRDINEIAVLAYDLRLNVLEMIMGADGGHIGGDMSEMEILTVLYFLHMNVTPENFFSSDHDHFILSKGHAVESYYAVLAEKGFFSANEVIRGLSRFDSPFTGHPNNKLPGIEMNTGSLGHGLSVAVGMALAERMRGRGNRVYTLLGDGELAEGSVWEAAMSAGHYKLDNLIAVIDRNRLQISGETEYVMSQDPLADRWASFGWNVISCKKGNNVFALDMALSSAEKTVGSPTILIANTTKGCGSAVMENKANWHHKTPTQEEYQNIKSDLLQKREALRNDSIS